MWTGIKDFQNPTSLAAAYRAARPPGCAYITGGTYLLAERPPDVSTLINIKPLLAAEFSGDDQAWELGAGMTLQQLASGGPGVWGELAWAAANSCASQNIRNQRTLGGEVARGRTDSDLLVLLHALKVRLTLATPDDTEGSLDSRDDGDLISAITVEREALSKAAVERFALLPSARPFVVVAGACHGDQLNLAAGGATGRIASAGLAIDGLDTQAVEAVAKVLAEPFTSDHHGSRQYKQALIVTAIRRIGARVC